MGVITFIVSLVLGVVEGGLNPPVEGQPQGAGLLSTIFSLATLLPGIAVTARRLHDVNRSGWWMLISLTIIGIIPLLIWNCTKGPEGDNRFGSDPLAGQAV